MSKVFILILFIFMLNIIQVSSLSVAVNVPEKYTDVQAGERFYFEISVKYPENPQRKDLRLEYEILDNDGNLIAQSKVLKAIETQASFIDYIVIPESTKNGIHFISVKILDYEELSEEVSSSFYVVAGPENQLKIYFLILLSAVLIIGTFVVISFRSLRSRRSRRR